MFKIYAINDDGDDDCMPSPAAIVIIHRHA